MGSEAVQHLNEWFEEVRETTDLGPKKTSSLLEVHNLLGLYILYNPLPYSSITSVFFNIHGFLDKL